MTTTGRNRWGATAQEQKLPLPGDDLVPDPIVELTHAVTVDASPEQVWPWLVQLGHGRAGFYSDSRFWDRCVDWYYRVLSRDGTGRPEVGYHIEAADRIVPAWQNPRVGDIVADGPPGTAYYVVRNVEPYRAFVLYTDTHLRYLLPTRLRDDPRLGIFGEISAGYLLTEPEPGKTRLIRRMRLRCGPWPFQAYAVPIVLVWGETITARRFLQGVKRRAEALAGTVGSEAGMTGGQTGMRRFSSGAQRPATSAQPGILGTDSCGVAPRRAATRWVGGARVATGDVDETSYGDIVHG